MAFRLYISLMTFLVNGIKERLEKKYNIELLLGIDSSLLAKQFLENNGIIVLSLKEYTDQDEKFGNVHFTVNYREQEISLVSNMEEDLPQICLFLFDIDFKVIDINFFKNPLPNDEVLSIIQKAKTQSEEKNQEIEKEIKTKVEAEKKIYTDDRLVTDKEIIERVFQKIHEITNLAQGEIEGKELKYIKEMEDELKKLKLGANHERIVEIILEVLRKLEIIENNYFENHKNEEKEIFEETKITDVDIKKELHKREKVQKLKKLGATINPKEQDYLAFGKYAIFPKFLFKDLKHLFTTPKLITKMIYNIYDLVELALISLLILIQGYVILDTIFLLSENNNHEFFDQRIIKIGLFGLLLGAARLIRKKDMAVLIILIPVIIILYTLLLKFINNNFSI